MIEWTTLIMCDGFLALQGTSATMLRSISLSIYYVSVSVCLSTNITSHLQLCKTTVFIRLTYEYRTLIRPYRICVCRTKYYYYYYSFCPGSGPISIKRNDTIKSGCDEKKVHIHSIRYRHSTYNS